MAQAPVPTSSPAPPDPAQWLPRYGDELYRFALSRLADPDTAEELVQLTFLNALDALPGFRGEASERTWLFTILRRNLIDHYRRQARHPTVSLDVVTPDGPTESTFFDPLTATGATSSTPKPGSAPTPPWKPKIPSAPCAAVRKNCPPSTRPSLRYDSWKSCPLKLFARNWG